MKASCQRQSPGFVFTLVALLAASTMSASAQSTGNLIVPGKQIGKAFVGMTPAQLYQALGKPDKTVNGGEEAHETFYYYKDLTVALDTKTQSVYQVNTASPKFRTKEGLGVGSQDLELRAKLGSPKCETDTATGLFLNYGQTGFILDNNGTVRNLNVRRSAWRC